MTDDEDSISGNSSSSGEDGSDRLEAEALSLRLREVCGRDDAEAAVGVLVSHFIDPNQSPSQIQSALDDFLHAIPNGLDVSGLLSWFVDRGFGAEDRSEVTAADSHLVHVINNKRGIPISQALLLIAAARSLGFSCQGINFPGHFLVQLEDSIVDPLRFEKVDVGQLRDSQEMRRAASPRMIALRMFNNLKALRLSANDVPGALDIVDIQLAISEDSESISSLHYERGEFWLRLGAMSLARQAYLQCAELCPHPNLAERARQKAAEISVDDETLH